MLEDVRKEACKRVETRDAAGMPNGFLVELCKDGHKTLVYLTAAYPKAFKGFHLHTVRASRLVCIKGKMKITIVENQVAVEHVLDAKAPERLFVPTNVWIGYENVGEEEAWMINVPSPPYDSALEAEQLEKTPEEITRQLGGSALSEA